MATSPDFEISISRPDFRALLLTCTRADRELQFHAEALPDSPDHDWSIILDGLRHWNRPTGVPLVREELEALAAALARRFAADGLRIRWD